MRTTGRLPAPAGTALTVGLGLGLAACTSAGHRVRYDEARALEAGSAVVTFVDFLEGGRRSVEAYLGGLPEAERAAIEAVLARASAACARLRIVTERRGPSRAEVGGSAVLVRAADGAPTRLVTAGHSFAGAGELAAVLSDGRALAARAVDARFERFGSSSEDWAVAAIDCGGAGLPALAFRRPERGEIAFVLSYPNQMGVSADGHVVYGEAYRELPLAPIALVARVDDASPLTLTPLAGALTMQGASGGAIVGRDGELLGVLTGSGWEPRRHGARYWVLGASVAAFADRLTGE